MIVYYSLYNNTHRFVQKLEMDSVRIPASLDESIVVDEPFVLITPTYSGGRPPKPVSKFLNNPQNRSLMTGVIGAGNRGFGSEFGLAADVIAIKCKIPVLYKFELMGTTKDVEIIKRGIENWWIPQKSDQTTSV